MDLIKKLTGKNPSEYEMVAKSLVDTSDVDLFAKLVKQDDFLFDFINFMCQKDGEEFFVSHNMTRINDYFEIQISFNKGLYFYYFD
mgnify:CR=1 FL=1